MRGKDGSAWQKLPSLNLYKPALNFPPKCLPKTSELHSTLELFNYFINQQIIEKIIYSTNKRLNVDSAKLDCTELKAFCGLLLLFGLTKKHDVDINEIYCPQSVNHLEWASVCMKRDRFKEIARFICFDDIDTRSVRMSSNPKFFKMSEVFDIFKNNLKSGPFILFMQHNN